MNRCKREKGKGPYLIGLTGGTASGKSSIAKRLSGLGAYVIDCDKVNATDFTADLADYCCCGLAM